MEPNLPLAFVIEDDPNLAKAFGSAVAKANYRVEVINDGAAARSRLQRETPELVVLDLHIPYVNGHQLLAMIRNEFSHLANTRVIVATADAAGADALREQADLVLLKPVGYAQLIGLAERLRSYQGG